jgi:uncharacterized protein YhaN
MTNATPIPQQGAAAVASQDDATRAAFHAACDPTPIQDIVRPWFAGTGNVRSLEDAVQARRNALKTGKDRLSQLIQYTQKYIAAMEKEGQSRADRRVPAEPRYTLAVECVRRYLTYLESVDAPSWEIARNAAGQESDARIEQQRRALEAQQRAVDEAAAERERHQKEAEVVAAQIEEKRKQREAAAAVMQRKEVEEATAKEEWQRPAREAAAKAAQNVADAAQREAEKLPGCADVAILKSVKGIVAASPAGVTQGLRISGLEEILSVHLDTEPAKRFCSATMMTTAGAINGVYTIRWTEAHDNVWIEVLGLN